MRFANLQGRAVIVIAGADLIDRAVDVETDDFLTKPIHKAELLLRVKAMLNARRQPSDLERTLEYIRTVEETYSG